MFNYRVAWWDIIDGVWHHMTHAFENGVFKYYLNGVLRKEKTVIVNGLPAEQNL
jgi:hypothetical protein